MLRIFHANKIACCPGMVHQQDRKDAFDISEIQRGNCVMISTVVGDRVPGE
jgi:hypothetical protein